MCNKSTTFVPINVTSERAGSIEALCKVLYYVEVNPGRATPAASTKPQVRSLGKNIFQRSLMNLLTTLNLNKLYDRCVPL